MQKSLKLLCIFSRALTTIYVLETFIKGFGITADCKIISEISMDFHQRTHKALWFMKQRTMVFWNVPTPVSYISILFLLFSVFKCTNAGCLKSLLCYCHLIHID